MVLFGLFKVSKLFLNFSTLTPYLLRFNFCFAITPLKDSDYNNAYNQIQTGDLQVEMNLILQLVYSKIIVGRCSLNHRAL
ncbi:hypothetical protein SAMN05421766_10399 [Zobellia uliginosa]|uniref:Uncharacterized protein n=1 Tax=Zobellia uliginosa TaxID=143224 RepID=A0ABY1KQ65_9FLAO|nr:hypothetical protein SAMN05421766_10399 [Zobellia uliginosa]